MFNNRKNNIIFSVVIALLFALIGFSAARVLNAIEHYISSGGKHLIDYEMIQESGLNWYGGFLFCLTIMIIPIFIKKINSNKYRIALNTLAISSGISYVIGRLGCLFSGDSCYGVPTTLPWGMHFQYGPSPSILPVHPTPIYESITIFLIVLILIKNFDNLSKKGLLLPIFLILFAISRFIVEFIRINDKIAYGLSFAQLISIYLIILAFVIIVFKRNETKIVLP